MEIREKGSIDGISEKEWKKIVNEEILVRMEEPDSYDKLFNTMQELMLKEIVTFTDDYWHIGNKFLKLLEKGRAGESPQWVIFYGNNGKIAIEWLIF